MIDTEERPVLSGLIALAAVALVVGVIGGLAMLLGVKATGIDGGADASGGDSAPSDTLILPEPTDTPEETESPSETEPSPSESEPESTPATTISLSSGQVSVSPMQQIDLSGTYPGGEGAILAVQRLEDGSWADFPVTAQVSGGTFATYVQTGRVGENKFRVVDTDTKEASNEVTVTVG